MKRVDLIKRIKVKMDVEPSDNDTYYDNFYDVLIDECLSEVANSVLPYQQKLEIYFDGCFDKLEDIPKCQANHYCKITQSILDEKGMLIYPEDCYLKENNGEWIPIKTDKYGFRVSIPDSLLSFSTEALIQYTSPDGDVILDAEVLYLNPQTICLPKDGDYIIWYNSEYPLIEDWDPKEDLTFIPSNVLQLIPSYVASELLASEDLQRSTILKNDYEKKLARLDDNKVLPSYSIKNNDGWTD